jgi:hypothetical protein
MDGSREPLVLIRFGRTSDETKSCEGGGIDAKAAPLRPLGLAKPFTASRLHLGCVSQQSGFE